MSGVLYDEASLPPVRLLLPFVDDEHSVAACEACEGLRSVVNDEDSVPLARLPLPLVDDE